MMLAVDVTANLRYIQGGHLYQTWNISIVSHLSYQEMEEMVSVLLKPTKLVNSRLQFESHHWTFLKDIGQQHWVCFFFFCSPLLQVIMPLPLSPHFLSLLEISEKEDRAIRRQILPPLTPSVIVLTETVKAKQGFFFLLTLI